MELTSKLAQSWIKFRLLTSRRAHTPVELEFFAHTADADIELLYREHLLDSDEREWALTTLQEAIATRYSYLKAPPNHED